MMDFSKLLEGKTDCRCGREHSCPIDHVHIGSGAVEVLPELTDGFHSVVLVADGNTYEVQGSTVERLLGDKIQTQLIYSGEEILVPDETAIEMLQETLTQDTDLIIGVGSGVINDICKYVSFRRDLPYYIVATAPSMDGYASNGAALILNGMKISPNARPPKAIIADTWVLKDAPMEMLQAGYGDIMGKLSCLNDWKLAKLINGEYFCDYVYDLTYDTVMTLMPLAQRITDRDEEAVGMLMEALVTVGVAMSFVGNSRPASGSEHHLSHFFEITGIVHDRPYLPHGIDVAYSAVLTAKLRQQILSAMPHENQFERGEWEEQLRRIYGSVAQGVIDLQDRLDSYRIYAENTKRASLNAIKECLSEAPDEKEMRAIIESVGLYYPDFESFYGAQVLADAVRWGKDLKDRYTVLWLYDQFFAAN